MSPEDNSDTSAFEQALTDSSESSFFFRLYVTGTTPRSLRAIQNLREMCEAHLQGRYELEVVDIYQQPEQAQSNEIVVTPTLVKKLPLPVRKIIGDLSDNDRVLVGLDLVRRKAPAKPPGNDRGK